MKTSRELLKMINKQHPTFPFTMRCFEQNRSRLGITECVRTNIVQPYPILSEKNGEFVAQFKFTVIVGPNKTIQITGLPLDMLSIHPSKQIQDSELNKLLSKKFEGDYPEFYEPLQAIKYDAMNIEEKEEKKGKKNKKSTGTQKKAQQQKKGNKKGQQFKYKQKKNQTKNKKGGQKQQQNKNKKGTGNKNRNNNQRNNQNQNQNQNRNAPQPMIVDLD